MAYNGSYWYVVFRASDANIAIGLEAYEELKKAMLMGLCAVEITTIIGARTVININSIAVVEESTPELRDAAFEWNQSAHDEGDERAQRLGKGFD